MAKFPIEINMLSYIDNSGCPRKSFFLSRKEMLEWLDNMTFRNEINYVEEEYTIPIRDQLGLVCTLNSLEEGLIWAW